MKHQFSIGLLLFWIFLNLAIMVTMDLALFMQTTPGMKDAGTIKKILTAEFWATIEWMFVIPSNRIGNWFLSAAQVSLSSHAVNLVPIENSIRLSAFQHDFPFRTGIRKM